MDPHNDKSQEHLGTMTPCSSGMAELGMTQDLPLGQLRVLGIGGSLRAASRSHLALEHAIGLARSSGCRAEIFDLRSNPLPFCNGDNSDARPDCPGVAKLRKAVVSADALILATPEYHGGMSGVLKNTLDLLEIEHLDGKVVGAISVLGGPSNCNALNDVRRVMRWCHAWVIPEQIAIGHAKDALAGRQIDSPDLLARFREFVRSLLWTTIRLSGCLLPEYQVRESLRHPSATADGQRSPSHAPR